MNPVRRILISIGLVVGVNLLLAVGYWLLNLDRTNVDGSPIGYLQCLYMTVVSTFTVGYGEIVPVRSTTDRVYTMFVIAIGIATIGYGLGQLTAVIVEGDLKEVIGRRSMEKTIAALRNHYIICGMGETGHYAVAELVATRRPLVAIDTDEARLKKLSDTLDFPFLVGDATDDAVLERAGVRVAAGVLCALHSDRDNLFLAMTCRQLNPKLRIATKLEDVNLTQRVRNAGADSVVSPQFIGGLRLVSELVRPTVTTFLDRMLRDRESHVRIEEIRISAESSFAGKRLNEVPLAQRGVLVLAVQPPGTDKFTHAPPPTTVLEPGMTVVVLAKTDEVAAVRREAGSQ
jgi:voltage-gated potassium channel